ncbi:MAG: helix-turn-helix domain-containing protein [Chitinophagales bacterium]
MNDNQGISNSRKNIKLIRGILDYTQSGMADFLGIHKNAYGNYERGDRKIPVNILKKIAEKLNISMKYLISKDLSKENITIEKGGNGVNIKINANGSIGSFNSTNGNLSIDSSKIKNQDGITFSLKDKLKKELEFEKIQNELLKEALAEAKRQYQEVIKSKDAHIATLERMLSMLEKKQ